MKNSASFLRLPSPSRGLQACVRRGRFRSFALGLAALSCAATAGASVTTLSFQPSPTDMHDLDHHMVYTWRIDNISLTGSTIASATLTFTNIANWDSNPNVLHLHLLDSAIPAGVGSFVDDPSGSAPVTDLTDDFVDPRFHNDPSWLVKGGTADTFLANPTFTTAGVNYTLNFTQAQINALTAYIANGNDVAFGVDPDCHFFNDGVKFTMTLTPVPEMSSFYPLLGLMTAVAVTQWLRRRRQAHLALIESEE